jgi:hypothetical protein
LNVEAILPTVVEKIPAYVDYIVSGLVDFR